MVRCDNVEYTIGDAVIYSLEIIGIDHLYRWAQCKCESVYADKLLRCS